MLRRSRRALIFLQTHSITYSSSHTVRDTVRDTAMEVGGGGGARGFLFGRFSVLEGGRRLRGEKLGQPNHHNH